MAEITNTILQKVSGSAVFVADLTPIGETTEGKPLPNPNVLIELGWALGKPGAERIIGILNMDGGYTPDNLPFDIRHRRTLTYELSSGASKAKRGEVKKKLVSDLTEALKINLGHYVADEAAAAQIKCVPAKEDDPSIWASCAGTLEYADTWGGNPTVAIPEEPRGYIRIIPSGWEDGIPSIAIIQNAKDDEVVWPDTGGELRSL